MQLIHLSQSGHKVVRASLWIFNKDLKVGPNSKHIPSEAGEHGSNFPSFVIIIFIITEDMEMGD